MYSDSLRFALVQTSSWEYPVINDSLFIFSGYREGSGCLARCVIVTWALVESKQIRSAQVCTWLVGLLGQSAPVAHSMDTGGFVLLMSVSHQNNTVNYCGHRRQLSAIWIWEVTIIDVFFHRCLISWTAVQLQSYGGLKNDKLKKIALGFLLTTLFLRYMFILALTQLISTWYLVLNGALS